MDEVWLALCWELLPDGDAVYAAEVLALNVMSEESAVVGGRVAADVVVGYIVLGAGSVARYKSVMEVHVLTNQPQPYATQWRW